MSAHDIDDKRFLLDLREVVNLSKHNEVLKPYAHEIKQEIVAATLRAEFSDILTKDYPPAAEAKIPKIIWWCWLQGENAAPDLVRQCLRSVKQNFPDYTINVIDAANFLDYVSFPEAVLEKFRRGIITRIHFSDLIRVELLKKYGGLWFDATLLFTGSRFVSALVSHSQFFCYQFFLPGVISRQMDMWFLASSRAHPLLCLLSDFHLAYWQKYNLLLTYQLSAIFCTLLFRAHPEYLKTTPPIDVHNCFLLQRMLAKPMDAAYFDLVCQLTEVHKLTHKFFSADDVKAIMSHDDTFYAYLMSRENFALQAI